MGNFSKFLFMKKTVYSACFILVSFLVTFCCRDESEETARYELSPEELNLLPYQYGEKINFLHSMGYSFDFTVTEERLEWKKYYDFCEWNCCGNDYFSYQTKTIILESAYPRFHIEFSQGGSRYHDYIPFALNMEMNYSYFTQFPYDSLAVFINDSLSQTSFFDSLVLHDNLFYDVVKRDFEFYRPEEDSTLLLPGSVYLNSLGLLQIEMTNNESFTLNQ